MLWQPWSWLYIVCFLDLLGASMIMPVFSTHLRSLGISHVDIGLLSSLYGATQLISGPVIGSWSDVNGRRSILCLSIVVCSMAYGVMGVVSTFHFFLLIRCALGLFKHTQTLCRAYVADIVPEDKQGSVYGLMNAFTSLSFTVGPVIGGHIVEMSNGFQRLTTMVTLLFILNSTVVYVCGNQNYNIQKVGENNFLHKISAVFHELYSIQWKSFWALFSVKLLFGLSGIMFFQNMSVIMTENFDISHLYMGYTISFYGFVSVLCNLGVSRIKHLGILPKSPLKSLTYTFTIMAITFLLLYIVDSYIIFVLGIIPLSCSHALTRILLTEVLLERSDATCRGSVVGASSSVVAGARVLAPFLSGLIINWSGVPSTLLVSSVIAMGACLLTIVYSFQSDGRTTKDSVD